MRLDTAEKRAQYRAIMTPKGAALDARSSDAGAAYTYEGQEKFYALAFRGSAGKPEFHYSYRNAEVREKELHRFFQSISECQERKAKAKAESSAYQHDVQVGDIFRASWGYDQTNIDYYQVVSLIGQHMAEVREIGQQGEETAYMQGNCVPAPGQWATESDSSDAGLAYKAEHGHYRQIPKPSRRVKIQGAGSNAPCFSVTSYCHAYRETPVAVVAGKPVFRESHWTAYA